ncbi:MAG: hypothetical protein HUU38_05200 [Anaerolineales bacterium]|nr:hypothetical protein [Anaerolineales bacterium]
MLNPLKSLAAYSRFIAEQVERSSIERSTLKVWSDSPYTGVAEGEVFFKEGYRLRMREELDFDAGLITAYGYEVYQGQEKLYWYDDFPHPNDPTLASTHPHHKHIPPNIKRHRIPAPGISFNKPNLTLLIEEIEKQG